MNFVVLHFDDALVLLSTVMHGGQVLCLLSQICKPWWVRVPGEAGAEEED